MKRGEGGGRWNAARGRPGPALECYTLYSFIAGGGGGRGKKGERKKKKKGSGNSESPDGLDFPRCHFSTPLMFFLLWEQKGGGGEGEEKKRKKAVELGAVDERQLRAKVRERTGRNLFYLLTKKEEKGKSDGPEIRCLRGWATTSCTGKCRFQVFGHSDDSGWEEEEKRGEGKKKKGEESGMVTKVQAWTKSVFNGTSLHVSVSPSLFRIPSP